MFKVKMPKPKEKPKESPYKKLTDKMSGYKKGC